MALHFQHFRTRLLVFLLVPLLLVLTAVYVAVERANTANAMAVIGSDLSTGVRNFQTAIDDRNEILAIASDAMFRDYAIRRAFETDHDTILSTMDNLMGRLTLADFMALTTPDGALIADTHRPALQHNFTEWQSLIEQARALDRQGVYAEAGDVIVVEGHPFHLSVLPFQKPDLAGWITLGFEIGSTFTADFKQTVAADVSVLFRGTDGHWQVSGSTLPTPLPALLADNFHPNGNDQSLLTLAGADYVTQSYALNPSGDVIVILQRSLTEQLAPYRALQQRLVVIFLLGMIVLVVALVLLSRNVTQPLQLLTEGARRIRSGDYGQAVEIPDRDEIGELAASFNAMATGLADRERVRDLLGKVVSSAIADELLAKRPELGGEEREVTVLFTDIRGFTTLSEGRSPQAILALLNEYFTMLTGIIETHHGVVDKYIGDAAMALFGAPLPDPAAPARAVAAALAVRPALAILNQSLAARGYSPLTMGTGIHSGRVVVGNMGSQSRLNYTAIGDGVNLASRLESLTKRYGLDIIVSDSTRAAVPHYVYLPLDLVRVKGKQEPVRIHVPLVEYQSATAALTGAVAAFDSFLQLWQQGDWAAASTALDIFQTVANDVPVATGGLIALYRQRLRDFQQSPPSHWDGVFTYDDK